MFYQPWLRQAVCWLLASAVAAEDIGTPDPSSIEYPAGAPPSAAEIELGKQLFFDRRLSRNQAVSCASCHNPNLGTSDGLTVGLGTHGNRLERNAPHLYNLAWSTRFFWDGHATTLEEQALGPMQAQGEMDMTIGEAVTRLAAVPAYQKAFAQVYGAEGVSGGTIVKALASFERTIVSRDSAWDRYASGEATALGEEARRGLELFRGKARCIECHSGPNFTDDSFHDLGLRSEDVGRGKFDPKMMYAFKTPGLRNAALTAPYMHDGSLPTLESVVAFYDRGGDRPSKDPLVRPLGMSEGERRDLVAFLGALTDPVVIQPPVIP